MVIDAKIQDFGDIITGKTPSTSNKSYWGCHYPFITPSDYGFNDRYIYTTDRQISIQGANSQKKTILPKNSICITCIGSTIGKICMTVKPSITNQQINSIICNENYDSYYVFYLLKYCIPFLQMYGSGTGSGVPIISKNKFGKIKLTAESSLPLQRRIASILSSYDNLIEANSRRIKILEQMAENLYKEWFVRFRFPGYQTTPIENGIPKGWKVEKLVDFANVIMGQSPESEYYNENGEGLPFHQGVGSYGDFYLKDQVYTTKGSRVAEPFSIIFSVRAPVGRININLTKIVLGRGVSSINAKNAANAFLLWLLKYKFSKEDSIGNGSIFTSVTKEELLKQKLVIPSEDILLKYNSIASNIEKQIRDLTHQSANLTRQRDLLLPRLMSGQLTPLTNQ